MTTRRQFIGAIPATGAAFALAGSTLLGEGPARAQELERLARETALQRARSSQYWEGPEWIDGQACCRECGEPIPQKRLEALPGGHVHAA